MTIKIKNKKLMQSLKDYVNWARLNIFIAILLFMKSIVIVAAIFIVYIGYKDMNLSIITMISSSLFAMYMAIRFHVGLIKKNILEIPKKIKVKDYSIVQKMRYYTGIIGVIISFVSIIYIFIFNFIPNDMTIKLPFSITLVNLSIPIIWDIIEEFLDFKTNRKKYLILNGKDDSEKDNNSLFQ